MKKLKWHLLGKVVFPKVFQIFGKQLATPIWITTCQYGFFNRNEKTQFFYQNSQRRVWKGLKNKKWKSLKFIYSEKPTKFCEISTLNLTTVHTVKSKVEISQIFVAFSKYMNFKITWAICPCKSMVTYALAVRSTSSMTTARTNLYWMIRYIRKWGIVALRDGNSSAIFIPRGFKESGKGNFTFLTDRGRQNLFLGEFQRIYFWIHAW